MSAIANMARLTKAGAVLAWSGARVLPDDATLPGPLALFARVTAPLRRTAPPTRRTQAQLSEALTSLGPSYIKLGQFLATRDDLIGRELARDLVHAAGPPAAVLARRGARRRRGRAGRADRCALRRVRPAGRRRLDRASA